MRTVAAPACAALVLGYSGAGIDAAVGRPRVNAGTAIRDTGVGSSRVGRTAIRREATVADAPIHPAVDEHAAVVHARIRGEATQPLEIPHPGANRRTDEADLHPVPHARTAQR